MTEVLSLDAGLDFIKRVNGAILAEYQVTRNPTITIDRYKGILNRVAEGRTIDGRAPADWLFAQPVANTKGSPGLYLSIQPRVPFYPDGYTGLALTVAAYERQVVAGRDERQRCIWQI